MPAIKRPEDHPKVQKAKARLSEARQKFDMVNEDAALASAMAKERRVSVMQLQARASMGDEKQEVVDKARAELSAIEARAIGFGDFEGAKAEFIAPYEAEYRVAYIEAAEDIEADYTAAIGARIDYLFGNFPDIAQVCAEVLEMAPVIDRVNHTLTGRGIPEAQIRQPWKNGEMGVIQRTLQAIKSSIEA